MSTQKNLHKMQPGRQKAKARPSVSENCNVYKKSESENCSTNDHQLNHLVSVDSPNAEHIVISIMTQTCGLKTLQRRSNILA